MENASQESAAIVCVLGGDKRVPVGFPFGKAVAEVLGRVWRFVYGVQKRDRFTHTFP